MQNRIGEKTSEVIARKRRFIVLLWAQDRLPRNRSLRGRSCFFLRHSSDLIEAGSNQSRIMETNDDRSKQR